MKLSHCFFWFLILVIIGLMSGCATLFHGSSDKINFSSDPSGAQVFVNGQLMGTAPLELKLESKHSYNIEFRKEGYQNKTVVVTASVGGGWIILDVLFGLVPIIVDAATGDWYSLDQEHINAALERQQGQQAIEPRPNVLPGQNAPQAPETPSTSGKIYPRVGTGHWTKSILDSGRMVVLEDGSMWDIALDDNSVSSKWPNATPISVGVATGVYHYQLIDVSQNKAVKAKYLGQR